MRWFGLCKSGQCVRQPPSSLKYSTSKPQTTSLAQPVPVHRQSLYFDQPTVYSPSYTRPEIQKPIKLRTPSLTRNVPVNPLEKLKDMKDRSIVKVEELHNHNVFSKFKWIRDVSTTIYNGNYVEIYKNKSVFDHVIKVHNFLLADARGCIPSKFYGTFENDGIFVGAIHVMDPIEHIYYDCTDTQYIHNLLHDMINILTILHRNNLSVNNKDVLFYHKTYFHATFKDLSHVALTKPLDGTEKEKFVLHVQEFITSGGYKANTYLFGMRDKLTSGKSTNDLILTTRHVDLYNMAIFTQYMSDFFYTQSGCRHISQRFHEITNNLLCSITKLNATELYDYTLLLEQSDVCRYLSTTGKGKSSKKTKQKYTPTTHKYIDSNNKQHTVYKANTHFYINKTDCKGHKRFFKVKLQTSSKKKS